MRVGEATGLRWCDVDFENDGRQGDVDGRQGDGSLVSCIQPDVAANKLLAVYDAAHEYYGI